MLRRTGTCMATLYVLTALPVRLLFLALNSTVSPLTLVSCLLFREQELLCRVSVVAPKLCEWSRFRLLDLLLAVG